MCGYVTIAKNKSIIVVGKEGGEKWKSKSGVERG